MMFMIRLDSDESSSQINQEGDKLLIDHNIIDAAFEEARFAPLEGSFGFNVA